MSQEVAVVGTPSVFGLQLYSMLGIGPKSPLSQHQASLSRKGNSTLAQWARVPQKVKYEVAQKMWGYCPRKSMEPAVTGHAD